MLRLRLRLRFYSFEHRPLSPLYVPPVPPCSLFGASRTCLKICMCLRYVISTGVISHDNAGVLCSDEIVEVQYLLLTCRKAGLV